MNESNFREKSNSKFVTKEEDINSIPTPDIEEWKESDVIIPTPDIEEWKESDVIIPSPDIEEWKEPDKEITVLNVEEWEKIDDQKNSETSEGVLGNILLAGWCGRCGYHYGENNSTDVYCPRCGMKRETLK